MVEVQVSAGHWGKTFHCGSIMSAGTNPRAISVNPSEIMILPAHRWIFIFCSRSGGRQDDRRRPRPIKRKLRAVRQDAIEAALVAPASCILVLDHRVGHQLDATDDIRVQSDGSRGSTQHP